MILNDISQVAGNVAVDRQGVDVFRVARQGERQQPHGCQGVGVHFCVAGATLRASPVNSLILPPGRNPATNPPRDAMQDDQPTRADVERLHGALRRERLERKQEQGRAARAERLIEDLPLRLAAAVGEVRRELAAEVAALRLEVKDLGEALDQIRRA